MYVRLYIVRSVYSLYGMGCEYNTHSLRTKSHYDYKHVNKAHIMDNINCMDAILYQDTVDTAGD